jgi:hypothetical protein
MTNSQNNLLPQIIVGLANLIGVIETHGATQVQWTQGALDNLVPAGLTLLTLPRGLSDPNSMPGPGGY